MLNKMGKYPTDQVLTYGTKSLQMRQGSKSPVRLQMTNDLLSNLQKAIFKQV
jgi:hypothetical protein